MRRRERRRRTALLQDQHPHQHHQPPNVDVGTPRRLGERVGGAVQGPGRGGMRVEWGVRRDEPGEKNGMERKGMVVFEWVFERVICVVYSLSPPPLSPFSHVYLTHSLTHKHILRSRTWPFYKSGE